VKIGPQENLVADGVNNRFDATVVDFLLGLPAEQTQC